MVHANARHDGALKLMVHANARHDGALKLMVHANARHDGALKLMVRQPTGHEAHEEAESDPNAVHVAEKNKCVILGTTPASKALALNLLKDRWGVLMLTLDEKEAASLQADVKGWSDYQRSEQLNYAQMYNLPPPVFPAVPLEDNFTAKPVPVEGTNSSSSELS
jgi:hypothetical protein